MAAQGEAGTNPGNLRKKQSPWWGFRMNTSSRGENAEVARLLGECLTQRDNESKVLQHHITVQAPLGGFKETPLLPGEVHGHVLKGHPLP